MAKVWTTRCASGSCVEVTETDDGFAFTSTIEGNDGSVTYTAAEVADFLTQVRAGRLDELYFRASSALIA